jgi:uncharacterized membrane protein YhaH (DUF805 family)
MSIVQMLFSFEGRMRRRDFWLCGIALCVLGSVLSSLLSALFFPQVAWWVGPHGDSSFSYDYGWPLMMSGFWHVTNLVWVATLWPWMAIGVKRCHDRDQTGLWVILAFVPVIGWLWWLINLGLLDGTPGSNPYGPSPKGFGGTAPATA